MRSHRQKQISVPTVCDLTLWLPPPCVLHPHEASSLTRGTGAVSEQSFPSFTPLSPPLNRKHTYQCRVHLPVPACPLCRCLLKPGILLPCSPGSVNTAVGSQATGRLHAWTGWHTARSMTGGSTSLIICADIDSPSASGFSFSAVSFRYSESLELLESWFRQSFWKWKKAAADLRGDEEGHRTPCKQNLNR